MKMRLFIFMLALNVLLPDAGARNNPYVDSLDNVIKTQKAVAPYDACFRMADYYRMNEQYDEAVRVANMYKSIAQKEKNVLETVKTYALLTNIFTNREDYPTAQLFQDSAALAAGNSREVLVKAYVNYARLVFYYGVDEDEMLSKLAQETLLLIEPDGKDPFLEGKCNYFLYVVNTFLDDFEKSRHYALKTIANAMQAKEMNLLASGYAALGTAYTYKYDADHTANYLDSIMHYTRLAGDCYLRYPGKVTSHTYYIARINEASYQLKYSYPSSPALGKQIVDSVQSILNFMDTHEDFAKAGIIANCYGIMATVARNQGNTAKALSYLKKGWAIVDSSTLPHLFYPKNNLLTDIANTYAAMGDYKKAFETQGDLFLNNAKLFDEGRSRTISQLEAQYQAEKKERELQVWKGQVQNQQRTRYLYMCLGAIGLVGVVFMFRSYHFRLKYSLEREQKLEVEKHDTQTRIRLQEEEQARLKAEQELLELQQQKLRDEMMVSQLQVQHKNEVLQQLKEKLNEESPVNIRQIIHEENLLDSDFENARFRIQEVHPNFFKTLNELSNTRLTSLDQKYCAYIYLSMDTKQIAQLLNVEPKSVRMTKYRLKQKFGLEKETDLAAFLRNIS
ncbi:MAG: hypothetical protein KF862_07720 [Chitinophagaceae bacterium]|nr:hypothetical protein [Chitinophagaceae bacterium]